MDGLWDNFQLLQASIPMLQPPSPCCNTTWSKEAIAAAEMRSPDGPSRSPSTTYAILPIAISFWSLLVYHIVRTRSGIAISTYLATRRLPPQHPLLLVVVILFLSSAAGSFYLLLSASCIIDERVWELYFFFRHWFLMLTNLWLRKVLDVEMRIANISLVTFLAQVSRLFSLLRPPLVKNFPYFHKVSDKRCSFETKSSE